MLKVKPHEDYPHEEGIYLLLDEYSLKAFEPREETIVCEINLLNGFWSTH